MADEKKTKRGSVRTGRGFLVAMVSTMAIGMIVLSQALSFGRWNEFQTVAANFNIHAILLGLCGIGLLMTGIMAAVFDVRLRRLESAHLNQSRGR
ncbi:MAG: hypothetical protein R3E87_14400 [Burkholderiaceae bacterium]